MNGNALSPSRAQYGAMEKWVPCQEDTRKRKAGPHKFSDTAFRAPSPLPVTNQGGFQYFTHEPERSGTKKPKQAPPPETVEQGNAETLAWVPYPPPLPSASSSWRSAVVRELSHKDTKESIIPCILYRGVESFLWISLIEGARVRAKLIYESYCIMGPSPQF